MTSIGCPGSPPDRTILANAPPQNQHLAGLIWANPGGLAPLRKARGYAASRASCRPESGWLCESRANWRRPKVQKIVRLCRLLHQAESAIAENTDPKRIDAHRKGDADHEQNVLSA
jgi:hypothetical protein